MTFVATWLVTTIATLVACTLLPGMTIIGGSWAGPILFSLVLAMVNIGIKPFVKLLSLPINILTLGIFSLFINAFMLELASFLSRNLFHAGVAINSLGTAIIASIIISLVSSLVISITGLKRDSSF
ncbi:MAG: phage holin family protein [Atopobiaceae bacterium]|nr:phage holin family protein [Atopobiaceae bacterium]